MASLKYSLNDETMKKIILFCITLILLSSCNDKAKIAVQNKLRNVSLEQVSWDGYSIANSLLPGETSKTYKVVDFKSDFPKRAVVKFYMKRGDNQVYLETKYIFTLDVDDNLLVVISDTTQVINPAIPRD